MILFKIVLLVVNLTLAYCTKLEQKPPKLKPKSIFKIINENTQGFSQNAGNNPIFRLIVNTYDFFWQLPRTNLLWDRPPLFWQNNTVDYIRWHQIPHNFPPYGLLDENKLPKDFFCYGLSGGTLPLRMWDPFGLALTSRKVVKKYRESELKHGRLAMLAAVGIIIQESFHPIHPDVGGIAITHMDQLFAQSLQQSFLLNLLPIDTSSLSSSPIPIPIDYLLICSVLMSIEIFALKRNWNRWRPNEYTHQYDKNIGIGNLKEVCSFA
jgi:hypothetical protein